MKDSKQEIDVLSNDEKNSLNHMQDLISLIESAINNDNVQELDKILPQSNLEGIIITVLDKVGAEVKYNLLHFASYKGAINCIKYLVEDRGMEINIKGKANSTLLHWLGEKNAFNIVKYCLKERKFDVDVKDDYGNTPLLKALMISNFKAVQALITFKADLHIVASNSLDCINIATLQGNSEVVKFLFKSGATIKNTNTLKNAIHQYDLVTRTQKLHEVKKLENNLKEATPESYIEIIKTLIVHGATKLDDKDRISNELILNMLKAQEYIDDILNNQQTTELALSHELEEMVLARVWNKMKHDFKAKTLYIDDMKSDLEKQISYNPFIVKVISKIEDFQYDVHNAALKAAINSFNISFCGILEDIKAAFDCSRDESKDVLANLLSAYEKNKDNEIILQQLDFLKESFESYLAEKKSYLFSHAEEGSLPFLEESHAELKNILEKLLVLAGIDSDGWEGNLRAQDIEAILFYSLNPHYQNAEILADTAYDGNDAGSYLDYELALREADFMQFAGAFE
jgi:ankyrin repeat protein